MKENSFSKKEKLTGEIRTGKLFREGKSMICFPLRTVYAFSNETDKSSCRVLVSVPKKKFKKATDRNRIKRQMREAYRLQKTQLLEILEEKGLQIQIGINFIADKMPEYSEIYEQTGKIIDRLTEKISKRKKG